MFCFSNLPANKVTVNDIRYWIYMLLPEFCWSYLPKIVQIVWCMVKRWRFLVNLWWLRHCALSISDAEWQDILGPFHSGVACMSRCCIAQVWHLYTSVLSTCCRVYLVASVPGRHVGNRKNCFGHMKLRHVCGYFQCAIFLHLRFDMYVWNICNVWDDRSLEVDGGWLA